MNKIRYSKKKAEIHLLSGVMLIGVIVTIFSVYNTIGLSQDIDNLNGYIGEISDVDERLEHYHNDFEDGYGGLISLDIENFYYINYSLRNETTASFLTEVYYVGNILPVLDLFLNDDFLYSELNDIGWTTLNGDWALQNLLEIVWFDNQFETNQTYSNRFMNCSNTIIGKNEFKFNLTLDILKNASDVFNIPHIVLISLNFTKISSIISDYENSIALKSKAINFNSISVNIITMSALIVSVLIDFEEHQRLKTSFILGSLFFLILGIVPLFL